MSIGTGSEWGGLPELRENLPKSGHLPEKAARSDSRARVAGEFAVAKVFSHSPTGTDQGIRHSLLGDFQALGNFLLLHGFTIVKLDNLLLPVSQQVGVFEEHVHGTYPHIQAREVFGVDPPFLHAGDHIFDQITDFEATGANGTLGADGSIGSRCSFFRSSGYAGSGDHLPLSIQLQTKFRGPVHGFD